MLSNLNVDELPKKIAFTANLGIIQYLKNKKQEAFLNLQKVKKMI
jgi:tetratricopeptide (TPR) repeat protein